MTDEELEKELRRMKGKRTCKKRLLAFMLIFAMLAGMVMNPIHLQAVEGGPEKEDASTGPPVSSMEKGNGSATDAPASAHAHAPTCGSRRFRR